MATRPVKRSITFASDFGLVDEFVGVVHSVLSTLAPGCRVVDLGHGIPPHDIRSGARLLQRSIAWVPDGALMAVVDPGVGGARRPVGVVPRDRPDLLMIGPDNGLLWPALTELGGPLAGVQLTIRDRPAPERLAPGGRTFDGRDVFAPTAARWCNGSELADLGEPLRLSSLVQLPRPLLALGSDWLSAEVTWIDRFGNVELAATADQCSHLGSDLEMSVEGPAAEPAGSPSFRAVRATCFSALGESQLGLLRDSSGMAAVVMNQSSASARLGVGVGDRILIRTAG